MNRLQRFFYRIIRFFVKLFYPSIAVSGEENLPQGPCVIVGNHSQMNGPIATELYFPGDHYIWCAGEMMALKEVPAYAFRDFWSEKPKAVRWFYKLLSYLIAPISVCVFNSAHTVPVYRDKRVLSTFRTTLAHLKAGSRVIIFPEHGEPCNQILCRFQEGFVDVARMYYKQTGEKLPFVPMYLAPKLKTMYLGKPIYWDPEATVQSERTRICEALTQEITAMARSLPRHRVVPYHNVPKKEYPYNV